MDRSTEFRIAGPVIIRECGSTLYVGLAHTAPPTNTNFRLTFLLTRLLGFTDQVHLFVLVAFEILRASCLKIFGFINELGRSFPGHWEGMTMSYLMHCMSVVIPKGMRL